ncbi:hypothetical protein H0264_30500 [Nocardia huaxiensis]|uniref:Uncharacterized protein n=1 Tax=Nocardia huaxiensis TaxID=2755382 RepID=A0A7D6Z2U9_9NOCA|nr:hypothetical protein [Nocardia huaxiensis]QLY29544.1 hypothetical protein H0264_30500 [Nocardia huaxiensis]
MPSKLKPGARRTAARIVAIGMLAALPLAAVSVAASADPIVYEPPAYVAPDPGTDPAIMLLMNQIPPDMEKQLKHEDRSCP